MITINLPTPLITPGLWRGARATDSLAPKLDVPIDDRAIDYLVLAQQVEDVYVPSLNIIIHQLPPLEFGCAHGKGFE